MELDYMKRNLRVLSLSVIMEIIFSYGKNISSQLEASQGLDAMIVAFLSLGKLCVDMILVVSVIGVVVTAILLTLKWDYNIADIFRRKETRGPQEKTIQKETVKKETTQKEEISKYMYMKDLVDQNYRIVIEGKLARCYDEQMNYDFLKTIEKKDHLTVVDPKGETMVRIIGSRECPQYNMLLDMMNCIGCEHSTEEGCNLQNKEWEKQQKKQSKFITNMFNLMRRRRK